jgi:uncharacterized surface protein with fasciclin (FAS1) repeats
MASQEGTSQDQTVDAGVDTRLETHSILETIRADQQLSNVADAFRRADMEGYIDGPDLVTLFAPLAPLDTAGVEELAALLLRHMMPGAVTEAELRSSGKFKTLAHNEVRVSSDGAVTRVGAARIVRGDIECTNGVVHVTDRLLTD